MLVEELSFVIVTALPGFIPGTLRKVGAQRANPIYIFATNRYNLMVI